MAHLKLMFVAAKPPPSHVFTEVAQMAAQYLFIKMGT
jgi:hypothetical protein